jgi:hypothetical protein
MTHHTLCAVAFACALLGLALPAHSAETDAAEEGLTATPYRPTVSNPAALPAPGRFELEAGFTHARGGAELRRRASLPFLVKYAFNERFGILIGGEAGVLQTDTEGAGLRGVGDTSVTLKFKRELNEDSALGLEAGLKLPSAKSGIGSGKQDYTLNGIYSAEVKDTALDFNLGYTKLGAAQPGKGRSCLGWAVAASRDLTARWGVALEMSGTGRRATCGEPQALAALTYRWSRRVVLDFGIAVGLTPAAPDRTFIAGFTVLF